jgi:molybdate transport system permease protein
MFTWWGGVVASLIISLPLMVKTAEAAIASVDKSMIETSYMLGYSEFETAIHIILPLAKNGIIAGFVLSFARAIGEFGATLMLAGNIPGKTNTMPLTIYSLAASGEWNKAHLLVLILTLMSMIFLMLTYSLSKNHKITKR